jgi:hypothetical protein
MSDRELRYRDRGADPASMTDEEIRKELAWLSQSNASGLPGREIEGRKWRLSWELKYRTGGGE